MCRVKSRLFKFPYLWLILFSNKQNLLNCSWSVLPDWRFKSLCLMFGRDCLWSQTLSQHPCSRADLASVPGVDWILVKRSTSFLMWKQDIFPVHLKLDFNSMAPLLHHFAWRKFPAYQTHPYSRKIIKPPFKIKELKIFFFPNSELYSSVSLS